MRKGFTLIEIIISITLIVIFGVSTSFVIIQNNNNNNDITEITNQVLESAKVYLETEIDEYGNSYKTGLLSGGAAVAISIEDLYQKGYIDEKTITTLQNEGIQNYNYILAAVFSDASNQCSNDESIITFQPNWDAEFQQQLQQNPAPVYICAYKKPEDKSLFNKLKDFKVKVHLDKYAPSNNENGIYALHDLNTDNVYYYYRGNVDNNYLELGTDEDGNKLIWRILWIKEDMSAKLILDKEIPLNVITSKNGTTINPQTNKSITNYSVIDLIVYNPQVAKYKTSSLGVEYYNVLYNPNNELSELPCIDDGSCDMTKDRNIYYQTLINWYNKTDLNLHDSYNKKSFCQNKSALDNNNPSETIDCRWRRDTDKYIYMRDNLFYSSPVGYITYGEALRAGLSNDLTSSNNIANTGSFLLSDSSKSYPLVDLDRISYYSGKSSSPLDYFYFINNDGLRSDYFSLKDYRNNKKYSILDPNELDGTENLYTKQSDSKYLVSDSSTAWDYQETVVLRANSVKPAIVLDLSSKELKGSGTETDPYKIVDPQ